MAKKLTFEEALQAINEQSGIGADEVQAKALKRFVWVAEWHLPGCLSESFSVLTTKHDAVNEALSMADHPRGMRAELLRYGRSDRTSPNAWAKGAITTIERRQLWTLF